MEKVKKAIVIMLSVIIILTLANYSLASTITTNNTPDNNAGESPTNDADENEVEPSNSPSNSGVVTANNTPKTINSSNVSENLPNTGVESSQLNLALILLLALVFGMFSLVQYNKIVKKEDD